MAKIWTRGIWTVKPGRDDDLVAPWRASIEIFALDG
jgi:hypothetical protein